MVSCKHKEDANYGVKKICENVQQKTEASAATLARCNRSRPVVTKRYRWVDIHTARNILNNADHGLIVPTKTVVKHIYGLVVLCLSLIHISEPTRRTPI